MNRTRVEIPASLDDGKRYDFAMVLPAPESRESLLNRMRQGVQDYFRLTMTRQTREMDVYVVTAPITPAQRSVELVVLKPR